MRKRRRGGNHIYSIAPGETVSLQVGFVVNKCELPYLYLDMTTGFNDSGYVRPDGYVDIRQ